MKCPECETETITTKMPVTTEIDGLIVGGLVEAEACPGCGEKYPSAASLNRCELQAVRRLLEEPQLTNGGVLRFARKALGMTQPELSECLNLPLLDIEQLEAEKYKGVPPTIAADLIRRVDAQLQQSATPKETG